MCAEMTAVNVQTAAKLYTITGVGYAPAGTITQTVTAPAALAGAQDHQAAAVAAATAAMASAGPASAAAGPEQQQELGEAELALLRQMLEGAVLCNDSHLSVLQDEATGGHRWLVAWASTGQQAFAWKTCVMLDAVQQKQTYRGMHVGGCGASACVPD